MGHSSERKRRTRRKILEAARRLFAARGFDATAIEDIMRECSLTRGGFYAHFASKAALYREVFDHGASVEPGECLAEDADARFAFFAADVASTEPEVRAAYASAFKSMSESAGLPAAAMIVGALAVAQTIDDPEMKSRLLASCRENLEAIARGGATQPAPAFFWEPTAC